MIGVSALSKNSKVFVCTVIYLWRCVMRLLLVFFFVPVLWIAGLSVVFSGLSFEGVARSIVQPVHYAVQNGTVAVQESYCADATSSTQPPKLVCSHEATRTVTVEKAVAEEAYQLRIYYWLAVSSCIVLLLLAGNVIPKWPTLRDRGESSQVQGAATARM